MTETRVPADTVTRACTALLKWWSKKQETSDSLIGEEETISITFSLKKIPLKGSNKAKLINIPHSLLNPEDDISLCLFTKDPPAQFKKLLEDTPVDGFDKVIGYTKLRTNYREYQQRRELLEKYDMFFADDRILRMLPRLIGQNFFKRKKHPVPVRIGSGDVKRTLEKARDSAYFYVPTGSTTSVRAGRTNFTPEELIANVQAVIEGAINYISRGWKNIQSIHMKTDNGPALPLYEFVDIAPLSKAHARKTPFSESKAGKALKAAKAAKRAGKGAAAGAGASAGSDSGADDSGSDGESEGEEEKAEVMTKKRRTGVSAGAATAAKTSTKKKGKKVEVVEAEEEEEEDAAPAPAKATKAKKGAKAAGKAGKAAKVKSPKKRGRA